MDTWTTRPIWIDYFQKLRWKKECWFYLHHPKVFCYVAILSFVVRLDRAVKFFFGPIHNRLYSFINKKVLIMGISFTLDITFSLFGKCFHWWFFPVFPHKDSYLVTYMHINTALARTARFSQIVTVSCGGKDTRLPWLNKAWYLIVVSWKINA